MTSLRAGSTRITRSRSNSCARSCACPPTRRPATTRPPRKRPPRCSRRWISRSSAIPCRAEFLRDYGMRSVTNLIVRHRFGDGGPTIALNAHGDVVPPGEGWTKPPYEGAIDDGPHVRSRRRRVQVGHRDLQLRAGRAARVRASGRTARRDGRAAFHLRRGIGRARRAGLSSRPQADQTGLRDRRQLQLRGRHRAQRLPAVRSHRARQIRPWRDARDAVAMHFGPARRS